MLDPLTAVGSLFSFILGFFFGYGTSQYNKRLYIEEKIRALQTEKQHLKSHINIVEDINLNLRKEKNDGG
tara:strand:- start:589 stop:798 length:210 start_codon:yes stop_codon:yes gene_type:complete